MPLIDLSDPLGIYRGAFGAGRDPNPDCPTEREAHHPYGRGRCGIPDPLTGAGYYCTRDARHTGDHVAKRADGGLIVVRWAACRATETRGRN